MLAGTGRFSVRLAACLLAVALAAPAAQAGEAFITNQGDDSVSVVDTTSGQVVQTVKVGAKPAGVAAGPGGRVYVTNPEGHSLSVLEWRDGTLRAVAEVPAGAGPLGVAVSPRDGRVFVADWYGDTVSVLDPATLAPVGTVRVGQSPSGLATGAGGGRLYVANRESDTLSVVDLRTLAVTATVRVGQAPFGVTVRGGRVFVANVQSGDVSVVDAETLQEVRRLKVGEFPYAIGVTPDGSRILVTNQHGGTLSVFDGAFAPLPDIAVGEYPEGIAVSADGRRAWVALWMDDKLAEIDVAAGTVVRRIPVGGSPRAFGAFLAPPRLAALPFTIINTSPAASTPEELARLHRLDAQLQALLGGQFGLVDTAPLADRLARIDSIRGCNGCELDMARSLGSDQVAYGWVQKVSNLILNVNLVIEDAATGRVLRADSVDIRGNTDESWTRGLRYLVNERLFRED